MCDTTTDLLGTSILCSLSEIKSKKKIKEGGMIKQVIEKSDKIKNNKIKKNPMEETDK